MIIKSSYYSPHSEVEPTSKVLFIRPQSALVSRLHSLFVSFQQRAAAVTAMAEGGHELEVSDRELEGYALGLKAALEAARREVEVFITPILVIELNQVEDALEESALLDWPEIDADYEALCRALACVDIIGICFVRRDVYSTGRLRA